ncbi:DUF2804 domain-containing protein [Microbacterium aurugineum]|uniref:DUF2804 domain-containing protein n=1 Tax=Microbacterium aurugineum TaxID=2851642 RepID=UPI0020C188DC|nr:DUF2804 domain-containing protein [Microbacterium aurugineum]MCK8477821.1 DUF2804 domain-containing protein [Microbacterium aurugineum]
MPSPYAPELTSSRFGITDPEFPFLYTRGKGADPNGILPDTRTMMPTPLIEREITRRVSLTTAHGTLNPDALGWSRTPLHDTSGIPGRRHWGRNKRWEYWNVMSPSHIIAFTVSCVDYLALHEIWVLDRATGEDVGSTVISAGGRSATLPSSLGEGPARARTRRLTLEIDDAVDGMRLRGSAPRLSFDLFAARPVGHESLGVVVPWRRSEHTARFQYTVKDVGRPTTGTVTVDDIAHEVPTGSWAVLDHGRGRWPYRVHWNWAAGSGIVDGRVVGLQLGSKWTDGSGATENALVVDGHLSKISEELVWDYDSENFLRPWRVHGETADLTFSPFYDKRSRTNAVVIASRTDQLFGVWTGWALDDTGTRVRVDGIEGFAEEVLNRW